MRKLTMKKNGFTLIELLVVITVIGLLASIVFVNLKGVRERARDARRVQDLAQLQKAVELYIDKYENVPFTNEYGGAEPGGQDTSNRNPDNSPGTDFMKFLITGGIMSSVPVDPVNNDAHHYWFYVYNGPWGGCEAVCFSGKYYIIALNSPERSETQNTAHPCAQCPWNWSYSLTGKIK